MTPRLIVISGPLKGTTFAFTEDEITVGRDPANNVPLNDPSVSRRHCLLRRNGSTNTFFVIDLESYNGTFVNGVPVAEQAVAHGDQISLGDIRFIFLTDESAVTTGYDAHARGLDDGDVITRSTIRLEREHAFYLRPEGAVSEGLVESRATRERNALLKISSTINSIRDPNELQLRLLEL